MYSDVGVAIFMNVFFLSASRGELKWTLERSLTQGYSWVTSSTVDEVTRQRHLAILGFGLYAAQGHKEASSLLW